MLIFILFRSEIPFLGWFGPNIQKSQFKTKFGIYNLLINYLNLMIQKQLLTSVLYKICLRGSRSQMFFEMDVFKNFAILAGKHGLESLNKVAGMKACKETPTQVFSCEYCEILKNIFFTEHLHWLLLVF